MNTCLLCAVVVGAAVFSTVTSMPHSAGAGAGAGFARCVNMWDEGCINDQLQGAGRDDDFVNGDFSPGKRCVDAWDFGCGARRAEDGNGKGSGEYPAAARGRLRYEYELLAKLLNNVQ